MARSHASKYRLRFTRARGCQQLAKLLLAHAIELRTLDYGDKAGRLGAQSGTRPILRAMASAVSGWSPVIMITRTPACGT